MLPVILVAVGAYLIGDSVLGDKKSFAEGGKMDMGGEINAHADSMTDSEFESELKGLKESERKKYDTLVRLGDSKKLALATVLYRRKHPQTGESHSYLTMAKGGKTKDDTYYENWKAPKEIYSGKDIKVTVPKMGDFEEYKVIFVYDKENFIFKMYDPTKKRVLVRMSGLDFENNLMNGSYIIDGYMAKGGEVYGDYKIKIEKKLSPYNKNYKGLEVKVDKDGVPLKYVLQALVDYKDKAYLQEAFDDKNVQVFTKMGARYVPLGMISKESYNKYVDFIGGGISNESGKKMMADGGMMAKGGKVGYTNKFQEVNDGGNESYYIRKFGVVEDENDKKIDLVVVANIKDLEDWVSEDELPEDGNFLLSITLVPLAKYMSKDKLEEANDYDSSAISDNSEVNVVNYMGGLNYNPEEQQNFKTLKDALKYLHSKELNDKISNDAKMAEYILDNRYNRAGSTNLDYLNYMTGISERFAKGGKLVGKQKKLDVNKNGKLDAEDFKMLRGKKMAEGGFLRVTIENQDETLHEIAKYMAKAVKKRADFKDLVVYFEKDNNYDYKYRVKIFDEMNVYEMKKTEENIYKVLKAIVEANEAKK